MDLCLSRNKKNHCHHQVQSNTTINQKVSKSDTSNIASCGVANVPCLQPQQQQLIICTRPQQYHSIRIDQPHRQAIHILPENYQFCSLGRKFRRKSGGPEFFGTCSAKVHFGICSDFEVFIEQDDPIKTFDSSKSLLYYKIKTPSSKTKTIGDIGQSASMITTTAIEDDSHPSSPLPSSTSPPMSPIDRSIVAKIGSYRDNLGAALELLTAEVDDEPTQLEDLIRNFVREDRRRQGTTTHNHQHQRQCSTSSDITSTSSLSDSSDLEKLAKVLASHSQNFDNSGHTSPSPLSITTMNLTTTNDLDSRGRKILLKKSQADFILQQKLQQNGNHLGGSLSSPYLRSNRDGVVQSRMIRFASLKSNSNSVFNHHHENKQGLNEESSLTPGGDMSSPLSLTASQKQSNDGFSSGSSCSGERTVFGISPKSSSLARYKNLIESRSETASIQQNFATGIDLNNLNLELEQRSNTDPSKTLPSINYGNNLKIRDKNNWMMMRQQFDDDNTTMTTTENSLDSSHFTSKTKSSTSPTTTSTRKNNLGESAINSGSNNSNDVIDTGKCTNFCSGDSSSCPFSSSSVFHLVNSSSSSSSYLSKSQPSFPSSSNFQSSSTGGSGGSKIHPDHQVESSSLSSSTTTLPLSPLLDFVARNPQLNNNNSSSLSSYHSQTTETSIKDDHYYRNNNNNNESSSPLITSNTIDTFIKENENFFQSGHRLSRSLGVIENSNNNIENNNSLIEMKYQQQQQSKSALTDDEKALLHETLKVGGLYGGIATGGGDAHVENNDSSNENQPKQQQKRRIIFVSKPAPKPEPKPEPKYVNGKVVFGHTHVKQHVLQKGSVAERVMLFEKCPEKTSVTKSKLNELQRNRITNPNKIGHWMKFTETQAVNDKEKVTKSLKIANNNAGTNAAQPAIVASTAVASSQNHEEPKSPPSIASISTFRRLSRSNSLTGTIPGQLPRFYYPLGRPYSSHKIESQIKRIVQVFERFPNCSVTLKEFGGVLKLCGIPLYWKELLFRSMLADAKNANANGGPTNTTLRSNSIDDSSMTNGKNILINGNNSNKNHITCDQFVNYWKKLISVCYDDASRFIKIITQGTRNYIIPEDFEPLIQDVIDTHPGLLFLKEAEEFHSRYVHTVIARIYYCVDKTWSGRITLSELKKSNLLRVINLLEEEDDINQITEYFSYEHFYVIYCKFWELDQDHDLFISKYDLSRHNNSAISLRMIDRIFSGAVTRTSRTLNNQMSYTEFVWFLLADEDKRHPRAIEYWFRCMDLDGDGYLSMYELEYFYSEQVKRMESNGIEALPFTDCLCQMIDLVSPKDPSKITLSDLKNCRLTPIFFDTFFNLEKYLDHEQRDPFASQRDEDGVAMSDWDRYAAEEYELLVAEESAQNNYYHSSTSAINTNPSLTISSEDFCCYPHHPHEIDYDLSEQNSGDEDYNEEEQMSTTGTEENTSCDDDDDDYDHCIDDGRVYIVVEPAPNHHNNLQVHWQQDIDKSMSPMDFMNEMDSRNVFIDRNNNQEKTNVNDDNSDHYRQKIQEKNEQDLSVTEDDFFSDIGKEFYDYIKIEFESSIPNDSNSSYHQMMKPIKLVKLDPVNKMMAKTQKSTNQRNSETFEDDGDFY